jgi:phosphatidylserine synthase
MPGEFYFMAIGGLGVTLAGFAGLIAALESREGEVHSPIGAWRIRNVVFQGFGVTFVAFATVATYQLTQNLNLTIQLATVAMVLAIAANWRSVQARSAWPDERRRRVAVLARIIVCAAGLLNVVFVNVGYLQLFLLVVLTGPASTFILAVADASRGGDSPT